MLEVQKQDAQVSIHAPYAGSDLWRIPAHPYGRVSIHAPYAGSDGDACHFRGSELTVSIHAPYAGSDRGEDYQKFITAMFQSTPPMQGAT